MNEIIEEHFMNPRNVGELAPEEISFKIDHGNPVCGDTIKMHVKLDELMSIENVRYNAYGCSTSLATASIISEFIKGKRIFELESFTKESMTFMLGELDPNQKHCIDIGHSIVMGICDEIKEFEYRGANEKN